MKFNLEIGEAEKHMVEFNFDQLLKQLVIMVNKRKVKRSFHLFNEPLKETHTLQVGSGEGVIIRIERERKLLFGQKCRVFLNDRLYKYYEGV